MKAFFITATGTEVGKTLVTCTLAWQLRRQGKTVHAVKPVVSGYDAASGEGDPERLLRAQGIESSSEQVNKISPWRFAAPLSPDLAARREGVVVPFDAVIEFCRAAMEGDAEYLLIEGAGGVLSPLTDTHTNRDLMERLGIPALLVTGAYLGAVTHALTAIEALAARGVPLQGVVVNAGRGMKTALEDTLDMLKRFVTPPVPFHTIPRLDFTEEIWKDAPEITSLLMTRP